jgi:hypothetical protein
MTERRVTNGNVKVFVLGTRLFCSSPCLAEYMRGHPQAKHDKGGWSVVPATTTNPVLSALLERAECEQCHSNLSDLARAARGKEIHT